MATVRRLRPTPDPAQPEPPELHARAMDNLAFIRETMESAASFTAVSGWGMVAIGVVALGVAFAAGGLPADAGLAWRWLGLWLGAAALSIAISAAATFQKARRAHMPILSGPGRKLLMSLAPPMLAGALLTFVFVRAGLLAPMPGMWMLLYGTAVVAGGAFSVRIVPVMGLCFMTVGSLALFAPPAWAGWLMALAFGGLHVIFGTFIARRHGG